MEHKEWFANAIGEDTLNGAAKRSAIPQKTLDGQIKRGLLPAESVIKLARTYGKGVIQALVDTGYLEVSEVKGKVTILNIEQISDAELLKELLRRVDGDGVLPSSIWDAPLDDDTMCEIVVLAHELGHVHYGHDWREGSRQSQG